MFHLLTHSLLLLIVCIPVMAAEPLRILAWNVESEGAESSKIADQLQNIGDYHVFALSEVLRSDLTRFADAIGHGKPTYFKKVNTGTGRDDRLEVIFDASRLELLESRELYQTGITPLNDERWRHRSPLVAKFRDKLGGSTFLLMVNHLARGDADLRTVQATGLRQWATEQVLPMIAVGDFNFDYDFNTGRGNDAFHEFIKDDVWKWIRPMKLVDTNWADHNEDGVDDYPDSMLDFAFVAGTAKTWPAACRVIVRHGDFPDNERTSDHRPVELIITPRPAQ